MLPSHSLVTSINHSDIIPPLKLKGDIIMLVYGFLKEKEGFMEIEDSLEAKQKFVGGNIEKTALTDCIDLISNEDSIRLGLKPRVIFHEKGKAINAIILGDCFAVRNDGRGGFESIRKEDEKIIKERLIYLKQEELALLGLLFLLS